jgi:hypothetical protein
VCERESVIVSRKTVRESARAREEETETERARTRARVYVYVCVVMVVCVCLGEGGCVCRVGACGRGGDPLIVIE